MKTYTKPTIVTGEEKVVFAIPIIVHLSMAGAAAVGAALGLSKGVVDVIHVNDRVRTINSKA